jgi:hypothetical protein
LKVRADFNGVFGGILCLSHGETCEGADGTLVTLFEGLQLTAFDEDADDGNKDYLLASGTVAPAPDWLKCNGSRWILRIDENGVRHESDLNPDEREK